MALNPKSWTSSSILSKKPCSRKLVIVSSSTIIWAIEDLHNSQGKQFVNSFVLQAIAYQAISRAYLMKIQTQRRTVSTDKLTKQSNVPNPPTSTYTIPKRVAKPTGQDREIFVCI
jgi:hypothetical protein